MVALAQPAAGLHQRMEALGRANEIRQRRRALKDELRDGSRRIEEVVREPVWWLFTVPVQTIGALLRGQTWRDA